jgi:hypothetical protein
MFRFSLIFGLLAYASPAWADAIDVDWYDSQNTHVQIKGPQLTTPAGIVLQGQCQRYEFAYQSPAGEPDTDKSIYMMLRAGRHDVLCR